MSFSALIDKLSTLVSKAYLFSAFIPVLVFGFVNGAFLWFHSLPFHRWAVAQLNAPSAFVLGCIAIGLAVAAYMLVSVNTFLREVLEGKHLPGFLRSYLVAHQEQKLQEVSERYTEVRDDLIDISESIPTWREALSLAAFAGKRDHKNKNIYTKDNDVAKDVQKLVKKLEKAEPIGFTELENITQRLEAVLLENDESTKSAVDDVPTPRSRLRADRLFLIDLFDRVKGILLADENRLLTERQFRFGFTAEPTALGNISSSVYSWAMIRYSMNIATFWSRLQPGLQAEANFYTVLQDAKVQVDFLVACCWLTTLTWLGWTSALAFAATSLGVWLGLTLGGPLLTYFFYGLSVTSYAAFCDLMRTSIDLYRFSVLRAMHISLPKGIAEERRTWRALQKLTVFGQDDVELSYTPDQPKAPSP